jgi:polyribonucleotide nucleotidyltransferase
MEILREALERAHTGRMHILDIMEQAISEPRSDISEWAPRIITIQINPEKIGEIIGPKGKTIRAIQEETGAQISIDDSGLVTIASVSGEGGERAKARIKGMTQDPEVGLVYEGVVKSTTTFGAFIEILPGTEGLLHISEMQEGRTERTEDVVKKGDVVRRARPQWRRKLRAQAWAPAPSDRRLSPDGAAGRARRPDRNDAGHPLGIARRLGPCGFRYGVSGGDGYQPSPGAHGVQGNAPSQRA